MFDFFLFFVAIFIIYYFYTNLGKVDVNDQSNFQKNRMNLSLNKSILYKDKNLNIDPFDSFIGLENLLKLEPSFDYKNFLKGAENAFSNVVFSFADGNLKKIKPLLNARIYKDFLTAVENRFSKKEILKNDIVKFSSIKILNCSVDEVNITIRVLFISNQISFLTSSKGVIKTASGVFDRVVDIWSFSKKINSEKFKWIITKIE